MRALVDRVTFASRPHKGTVVHLEKKLEWQEGSIIQHWTEDKPQVVDGPWSHENQHDVPVAP
jgi:hypothetical protein